VPVTASIGAVTFVSAPGDIEEMVHDADVCMYSAKKQGGDQVRVTVASSKNIPSQRGHPFSLSRSGSARQYFRHHVAKQTGVAHPGLDAASRAVRDAPGAKEVA